MDPETFASPTTSDTLSAEIVRRALENTRYRARQLEEQVAALQKQLSIVQEEETLYERLLLLREGHQTTPDGLATRDQKKAPIARAKVPESQHPIVDAVAAILEEEERPLHIAELMLALEERKVELPGAGQQANVISHLRRDSRFIRPARGVYALASSGLPDIPATPRTKQKRRRKVQPNEER